MRLAYWCVPTRSVVCLLGTIQSARLVAFVLLNLAARYLLSMVNVACNLAHRPGSPHPRTVISVHANGVGDGSKREHTPSGGHRLCVRER